MPLLRPILLFIVNGALIPLLKPILLFIVNSALIPLLRPILLLIPYHDVMYWGTSTLNNWARYIDRMNR